MTRVKYIDCIKFFAIIAVVFYHAGYLKYGYLGVDIFLVVNGYFITKVLERQYYTATSEGRKCSFFREGITFLSKRILRLLPLLIIAGIVCMLWGYFVMLPDAYENLGESVVATNLFSNNVLEAIVSKDYWALNNNFKPLMHTWYVGIIFEYYVFYYILHFYSKKATLSGGGYDWLKTLLWILGGISLFMYIGVQNVNLRFYHLPCRFFEFATGGIVFLYQSKIKQKVAPIVGYLSYLLLLLILIFDIQLIPSNIKLLFVVGVTAILLMSFESLENGKIKIITSNKWLGVIGAASFSVYVWHQIVFAFVRYSFTSDFSLSIFVGIILLVSVLSSLSYIFIEKTVSRIYNNKKRELSIIVILVWIISTGMAGLIYLKAGVVRDVPELDIYAQDTKRNMHSVYNESASQYAGKQFSTNKSHWLILGNSFAKDWANVIMESEIKDNVELSIDSPDDVFKPSLQSRIKNADRVFISMLHVDEDIVDKVLSACILNGLKEDQLFIVGEKDFGQSTGQIYWKRGSSNYYKLTTLMDAGFYDKNEKLKLLYKEQFVDLIGMVLQEDGKVLVFTNNGKYISQDTAHLTKNGAKYYAEIIDWRRFFDK